MFLYAFGLFLKLDTLTRISILERHCDVGSNLGFAFRLYLDCFLRRSDVHLKILQLNNGTNLSFFIVSKSQRLSRT
jgi:hypothetical protein